MAFDDKLAERLRKQLASRGDVQEKKMFGGLAFLVGGSMCVGVHGDKLIVRLDPATTERALRKPHTRRFDLTGRPMNGWLLVEPKGLAGDAALGGWVATALGYVDSLPEPGSNKPQKGARAAGNDKGRRVKGR